jgi:hypothetical protein
MQPPENRSAQVTILLMVGTQLDIQQIAERAREFHARMKSVKASIAPCPFEWYSYDSRANDEES